MKTVNGKHFVIPPEVKVVSETLKKSGFESYIVGGCTRDLFLERAPKDWDFTTNATPEQIISLFPETFYENDYGTVGAVFENPSDPSLKVIEITPYRLEAKYSDNRRPDAVTFSNKLEEDLKRRDFTINAIAYDVEKGEAVDLFGGKEDLKNKIIRTVGDPHDRFNEDALRILRAIRLQAELGFTIEAQTMTAIAETGKNLGNIAEERIRDEFTRIIMSDNPMAAIIITERLRLLQYIVPELEDGVGVTQNHSHIYDVWEHSLRALQHAADKKFSLEVRLAVLFHDIGKPKTRRETNGEVTFYSHEVAGAQITYEILTDLKFPKQVCEKVSKLVRWHMFFSDTEQITHSAVRRIIAKVGKENIWDLMNVRICDRIGMGRPKEDPYRLRKYHVMIEEVMRDPISVGMLAIDGNMLIAEFGMTPGPKIGQVLNALLEEVLEDPKKNTKDYLGGRVRELMNLSAEELMKLAEAGKDKKELLEEEEVKKIRRKHKV